LKIGIEKEHQFSAREFKGGPYRGMVSEVARELKDSRVCWVRPLELSHTFEASISTAIVHQDDLIGEPGLGRGFGRFFVEALDRFRALID
jgi:hypothetical protein